MINFMYFILIKCNDKNEYVNLGKMQDQNDFLVIML